MKAEYNRARLALLLTLTVSSVDGTFHIGRRSPRRWNVIEQRRIRPNGRRFLRHSRHRSATTLSIDPHTNRELVSVCEEELSTYMDCFDIVLGSVDGVLATSCLQCWHGELSSANSCNAIENGVCAASESCESKCDTCVSELEKYTRCSASFQGCAGQDTRSCEEETPTVAPVAEAGGPASHTPPCETEEAIYMDCLDEFNDDDRVEVCVFCWNSAFVGAKTCDIFHDSLCEAMGTGAPGCHSTCGSCIEPIEDYTRCMAESFGCGELDECDVDDQHPTAAPSSLIVTEQPSSAPTSSSSAPTIADLCSEEESEYTACLQSSLSQTEQTTCSRCWESNAIFSAPHPSCDDYRSGICSALGNCGTSCRSCHNEAAYYWRCRVTSEQPGCTMGCS